MSFHLDHFGLSTEPFTKEIDDASLWLPPSKRDLLDELVEAIEARESVVLTGEPGVGKTCVLRALRHALAADRFRLTYCHNATLGRRDFYRQLCLALGLQPSATAAAVFYAVTVQVEDFAKERLHPVFLLDEAHLLHQDTLDHLHILLNYAWDSKALLSLVLVGLSISKTDCASGAINPSTPVCIAGWSSTRSPRRTRPTTSGFDSSAPRARASSSPLTP